MNTHLVNDLFATKALRVSPADAPFWYTSGLFGPYYINTHFLFGSEVDAVALLQEIEKQASVSQRHEFNKKIAVLTKQQYERNEIYRAVIDALVEAARNIRCDFVSGGERRDFFFSFEVARLLGKPHMSIFKDLSAYYSEDLRSEAFFVAEQALQGKIALHVADLITEASSYFRAWIPAIEASGAILKNSLAVIDRCQGGILLLEEAGVEARCLLRISAQLFAQARKGGLIDAAQEELLLAYGKDPHDFVHDFLSKHPHFLAEAASKDSKTAERVARLEELLAKGQ